MKFPCLKNYHKNTLLIYIQDLIFKVSRNYIYFFQLHRKAIVSSRLTAQVNNIKIYAYILVKNKVMHEVSVH